MGFWKEITKVTYFFLTGFFTFFTVFFVVFFDPQGIHPPMLKDIL
jgi:hypothetical protein